MQSVLETVHRLQLLSIPEYLNILQLKLDSRLQGFRANSPSFQGLDELLGENWLGEVLINARLDLLTVELNRTVPNLIRLLPCHFHLELINSFDRRRPSALLATLREEMLINPPCLVAFLLNKNQCHWAATVTALDMRTVFQGDSAGYDDESKLTKMMQWWLGDVVAEDGVWVDRDLPVPRQDADSGSCGLAAVSAIVKLARLIEDTLEGPIDTPRSMLWTNGMSFAVRCEWMQLLLRRHLSALGAQQVSRSYPVQIPCIY